MSNCVVKLKIGFHKPYCELTSRCLTGSGQNCNVGGTCRVAKGAHFEYSNFRMLFIIFCLSLLYLNYNRSCVFIKLLLKFVITVYFNLWSRCIYIGFSTPFHQVCTSYAV
jgi:hypothetical protein